MTGEGARGIVEAAVRRELFGPEPGQEPLGAPIDCSGPKYRFATKEEGNGQFHDRDTLEEVLTRSDPLRRYGVGVLYSGGSAGGTAIDEDPVVITALPESEENPDQPPVEVMGHASQDEVDSDDFDLSDANRRKPSAMAISFKVRVPSDGTLDMRVTGAYYDRVVVTIPGVPNLDWWVRRPFELDATVSWRQRS